jgi:protocatechuate 3,4-dioxygenase alpha subunit
MNASPIRPRLLSLPRIEDVATRPGVDRGRRNFLSWLAAGTAMYAVGCATNTGDGESEALTDDALATDVDATGCKITTRDALGPYYQPGAPLCTVTLPGAEGVSPNDDGVPLLVEGALVGPDCRTPLKNYVLDLWQASAAGKYSAGHGDFRLRGKIKTDQFGRYSFQTILPGRYADSAGIRPAHIHVTFRTPAGNALLTTQMYFAGDPYLGDADYCTEQGTCNSADPLRQLALQNALVGKRVGKRTAFDAVMPRT